MHKIIRKINFECYFFYIQIWRRSLKEILNFNTAFKINARYCYNMNIDFVQNF